MNLPPFEPNFESDTVLGFAALDLTVLVAGMPTVSGWYNIVDFSNKCNGQIKVKTSLNLHEQSFHSNYFILAD